MNNLQGPPRPVIVTLAGHKVELSPLGIAWIPDLKLLCAADLHFEKASFFSRFSTFLPPYDGIENLRRLQHAIDAYCPEVFIAIGDSFHDRAAGSRMTTEHITALNTLIASVGQWHWLVGNHDPDITETVKGLRGVELNIAGITFRHQTQGISSTVEISGHFHPKTHLSIKGHSVGGPCFALQRQRLILPAFGAYTGGLDVNSAAFQSVMPLEQRNIYLLHADRVFAV
jgi:DNA ligase-associated metallophosphoesterase